MLILEPFKSYKAKVNNSKNNQKQQKKPMGDTPAGQRTAPNGSGKLHSHLSEVLIGMKMMKCTNEPFQDNRGQIDKAHMCM